MYHHSRQSVDQCGHLRHRFWYRSVLVRWTTRYGQSQWESPGNGLRYIQLVIRYCDTGPSDIHGMEAAHASKKEASDLSGLRDRHTVRSLRRQTIRGRLTCGTVAVLPAWFVSLCTQSISMATVTQHGRPTRSNFGRKLPYSPLCLGRADRSLDMLRSPLVLYAAVCLQYPASGSISASASERSRLTAPRAAQEVADMTNNLLPKVLRPHKKSHNNRTNLLHRGDVVRARGNDH